MAGTALGLAILTLAPASEAQERTRVDLHDAKGRRNGHVIVDERSGRIDFYDNQSRRTGYGRILPDGRAERFDLNGRRLGTGTVLEQPKR